jgi:hypothetical protein
MWSGKNSRGAVVLRRKSLVIEPVKGGTVGRVAQRVSSQHLARLYPRALRSRGQNAGVRIAPVRPSIFSTLTLDDPPGKSKRGKGHGTPAVGCGELTKESVIVPIGLAPSLQISVVQTRRRCGAGPMPSRGGSPSLLITAGRANSKPPHSGGGAANARLAVASGPPTVRRRKSAASLRRAEPTLSTLRFPVPPFFA